jgi:hypothetical protein
MVTAANDVYMPIAVYSQAVVGHFSEHSGCNDAFRPPGAVALPLWACGLRGVQARYLPLATLPQRWRIGERLEGDSSSQFIRTSRQSRHRPGQNEQDGQYGYQPAQNDEEYQRYSRSMPSPRESSAIHFLSS